MKQQNQASSMIHPKVRIKKRKRKKDLDKLKDNILNKRKTGNKLEELVANGGKQRKLTVMCNRLLPEPCIGLYRNGAKSKQLKKSRSLAAVQKNEARIQGDIIKLLDGQNSPAKAVNGNNSNSGEVTEAAGRSIHETLVDQSDQQDPLKGMSPTPTGFTKNLKPQNLPEVNERLQSVGRWRWSPLNCFEEFCAKISTEKFVNLSVSGFPDPVRECRRVLAEMYRETTSCEHVNRNHEDVDSTPAVATEEITRTRRRLLVLNKARDKSAVNLEPQKFNNVNVAPDEYTKTDNRCTVSSSAGVITDVYNQVIQKTAINREALEGQRGKQTLTSIDASRVQAATKIPCHIDQSVIIDYCPTGSLAPAQWLSCEPQILPYTVKRVESPGVSAGGPIFPFTLNLNIHKFWENDTKSKLDTTHSLLWTVNEDCYRPTDFSKSYASYFPYKYENALKRSEVFNDGPAPKPLKNDQLFEPLHPEKPAFHKRNKSFTYKSGQIHNHNYQTGEADRHHSYRVYANDINEAVVSDFRVLSFNDDQFKQAGKLAKDPRSRRSGQTSQPTKYFAVKNESGLSFSPQRVPIYYHQSRDEEKSHFVGGKKPYYQPIRILRPAETGAEKN